MTIPKERLLTMAHFLSMEFESSKIGVAILWIVGLTSRAVLWGWHSSWICLKWLFTWYHGKSPCVTTIWENMCYFFLSIKQANRSHCALIFNSGMCFGRFWAQELCWSLQFTKLQDMIRFALKIAKVLQRPSPWEKFVMNPTRVNPLTTVRGFIIITVPQQFFWSIFCLTNFPSYYC